MQHLSLILLVAVVLFAVRISGFYLGNLMVSPDSARFLRYTPFGALTALVVAGLVRPQVNPVAALCAVVLSVVTIKLTNQLWAGILTGLGLYWLLLQFL